MDYETAKKLKDAGFPDDKIEVDWKDPNNVIHPTLSELIEACGENFSALEVYREDWVEWEAYQRNYGTPNISGKGSTPEIAVATLWLELNKK